MAKPKSNTICKANSVPPRKVTASIRHGFATISNQGVALWRPYFTNLKKTALPSFYLSDFRVRHQAHDCTATPIKRVAYQHRRFQGALRPLTRTTFEKVDETLNSVMRSVSISDLVEVLRKIEILGRVSLSDLVVVSENYVFC